MITVTTNFDVVATALLNKLQFLRDPRPLLRPVALDVLNLMNERIHSEGKAADGSAIGTYSVGYLRFRSQNGRGSDTKKIESFTRQLSSALGVVATEKGWGIGVLVSARNPLDNYLNKKNKAKGTASSKKVGTVKKKNGRTRLISNNDLIRFQERQAKKKIWSPSTAEKDYAIGKLKKLVHEKING
jgi:hypothetical protein